LESGVAAPYTKSWIWNTAKIPLKVSREGLGWSNQQIATKMEENVEIPDSRLTTPSDVKITYDSEKSEFAKRRALARFESDWTGKLMVIRLKVEKQEIKLSGDSKMGQSKHEGVETQ
jgi:hypothetical protein